ARIHSAGRRWRHPLRCGCGDQDGGWCEPGAVLHRAGVPRSRARGRVRGSDPPAQVRAQQRPGTADRMNGSVRVQRDVSLRQLNTFHVPARARLLAEVADAAALPELLAHPDFAASRPLVLGGGSNLLFVSDPVQPLLMLTGTTVQVLPDADGCAIVRAAAGVAWHDFVLATVDQGMGGLENLALIPGTV